MGLKIGKYINYLNPENFNFKNKCIAIDGSYLIISSLKSRYVWNVKAYNRNYKPNYVIDNTMQPISHLQIIFYKIIKLYELGCFPIFCFDGIPDDKKRILPKHRFELFNAYKRSYEAALKQGDKKLALALATSPKYLFTNAVRETQELISAMGIPYIISPSEAESQCAQMYRMNIADYILSTDFDVLLFGGTNLLHFEKFVGSGRNLRIVGKLYNLNNVLNDLGINRFQLIDLAIMIGNDYFDGIPEIGFKTALKLIKEYGSIDTILKDKNNLYHSKFINYLNIDKLNEIRELFIFPIVLSNNLNLTFNFPKRGKIIELLCIKHNLDRTRIEKGIDRLIKSYNELSNLIEKSSNNLLKFIS